MKIHLKTFDLDTVPFANMMYIKKLKQKEDKVSESLPSFAILPKIRVLEIQTQLHLRYLETLNSSLLSF